MVRNSVYLIRTIAVENSLIYIVKIHSMNDCQLGFDRRIRRHRGRTSYLLEQSSKCNKLNDKLYDEAESAEAREGELVRENELLTTEVRNLTDALHKLNKNYKSSKAYNRIPIVVIVMLVVTWLMFY